MGCQAAGSPEGPGSRNRQLEWNGIEHVLSNGQSIVDFVLIIECDGLSVKSRYTARACMHVYVPCKLTAKVMT